MPLISIIIATYNASETLCNAINSVLAQSYKNWECIIVDGASKDNTIEIIKSFCEKDSRIRYISEPDEGIYDAFNKGWKLAKGEWIHYLGSDDKLTPNGIMDLINNAPFHDLIVGDTYIITSWGEIKEQISNGIGGCHQSMITKKSVLERLNGFNTKYKILADKDLLERIKKNGYKIKNVHSFVSYFSSGGISQNRKSYLQKFKERYNIYKTIDCVNNPFLVNIEVLIKELTIYIINKIMH